MVRTREETPPRDTLTGLWRVVVPVGDSAHSTRNVLSLAAPWLGDPPLDAVLLGFDVDDFRGFNHTCGRPAGDALLTAIAARLREAAGSWPACRWGSDEFIVAARLHDEVATPAGDRHPGGTRAPYADGRKVTVSAGVACAWPGATVPTRTARPPSVYASLRSAARPTPRRRPAGLGWSSTP